MASQAWTGVDATADWARGPHGRLPGPEQAGSLNTDLLFLKISGCAYDVVTGRSETRDLAALNLIGGTEIGDVSNLSLGGHSVVGADPLPFGIISTPDNTALFLSADHSCTFVNFGEIEYGDNFTSGIAYRNERAIANSILTFGNFVSSVGVIFGNFTANGASVAPPSFVAGTGILTTAGERPIESVRAGNIVVTQDGDTREERPVKRIGRTRIDLSAHPRPAMVAPVRIRRGALADDVPHRDLLVSPDHAVLVDGKLIGARQLINGCTIYQELNLPSAVFYHVELDRDAVVLAYGLPTVSVGGTAGDALPANANPLIPVDADLKEKTADPPSMRRHLADRASALRQPAPPVDMTTDPALRVIAKGRTLKPVLLHRGRYVFALPKGTRDVRIASRLAFPFDTGPALEDQRRIGVNVGRIVLRDGDDWHDIPVDYPGLSQGWWPTEAAGMSLHRWTSGDAAMSLPETQGAALLELEIAGDVRYIATPDESPRFA